MSAHEFDAHADSYRQTLDDALAMGGGDSLYYAERKFAALRAFMAERSRATPTAVLDFGCGTGTNLPFLRELFADAALYGVDVSSRSLELAGERHVPDCQLTSYDGKTLPFDGAKFDVVVVSNVLHHIEPPHRAATLKEIARCMKPGGLLVVFEHNPANPVTRKVVRDCPFDVGVTLVRQREIQAVLRELGYRVASLWNIIFVPAALKKMNPVERSLRWLPLGAQYALFAEWQG
ncbi:class I SAM-dependent methyltransferase [Hydrogenophaga sp. OTU3427]|uniref:class I SAM-dependent methyltransferase n=1 Tax=Hydrogenophaga sp. OTU3427 TaxID=3043856 RepID=UPI00313F32AC